MMNTLITQMVLSDDIGRTPILNINNTDEAIKSNTEFIYIDFESTLYFREYVGTEGNI